jgi:hypothetical protein
MNSSHLVVMPRIDEHACEVGAPPEACWHALVATLPGAFGGASNERLARLLGCDESASHGRASQPGSTLPGFRVDRVEPARELALCGAHRFSRYELTFRIDELEGGRSRVRAETRAEFPGLMGSAYRAVLIGSRGHVLVVKRLLRVVARRAGRQVRGA